MTNPEMYAVLVGFVLPPLLSIIMQWKWSSGTKAVVAFVACLVAGAGTAYFSGQIGRDVLTDILIVFVTAKTTYEALWKPTGVTGAIMMNVANISGNQYNAAGNQYSDIATATVTTEITPLLPADKM